MAGEQGLISIEHLRQRAQAELETISIEDKEDALARAQALSDLERYAKVSKSKASKKPSSQPSVISSARPRSSSGSPSRVGGEDDESVQKGPKLRTAHDVLNRIRWDPSMNIEQFTIGYLERFDGMMTMPASQWIKETTEEDFIPQHRIKWIKRRDEGGDDEVVWDRDARVDRLFGSA